MITCWKAPSLPAGRLPIAPLAIGVNAHPARAGLGSVIIGQCLYVGSGLSLPAGRLPIARLAIGVKVHPARAGQRTRDPRRDAEKPEHLCFLSETVKSSIVADVVEVVFLYYGLVVAGCACDLLRSRN